MFNRKLVKGFMATAMAATLAVTSVAPMQKAAASNIDTTVVTPAATNTTFSTARDLSFNTSNSETMSNSDSKRYYKFTLDEASAVVINAKKQYDRGTWNLKIYDNTKTEIYNWGIGMTAEANSGNIYLNGGTYYICLSYSLETSFLVTADPVGENFTESQDSDNNSQDTANNISLNKKYKGVLCENDDVDYYKFSISADGKVTMDLNNATNGDIRYTFYDSSFNSAYSNVTNGKLKESVQLIEGTYYVGVKRERTDNGTGSYTFNLSFNITIPNAPYIGTIKNSGKKKMTIKWEAVSNADGYELQYGKRSNFKGCVTKSYSPAKESVSFKKLTKKKKYYVRMRSYVLVNGEKKYSPWGQKRSVVIKK